MKESYQTINHMDGQRKRCLYIQPTKTEKFKDIIKNGKDLKEKSAKNITNDNNSIH